MSPDTFLANQLLIASPALDDPNFARAVTLVCQHDDEGAMGLVINRRSEYTLGEVLQQMHLSTDDAHLREQLVLSGGPVHPERGFVLHNDAREWESTLRVADGLYLTTSRDILAAMAAGLGPEHAIVTLGCAGWGAGQLEYELGENTWLTAPADAGVLFDMPLEQRWQAAGGLIGVDMTRLTDYSGHA